MFWWQVIRADWNWGENLWFSDVKFTHTSAQGAAVEPKDFSRTVLSADFPPGLLKHPNNVVTFM
jgi:hypothetical protein